MAEAQRTISPDETKRRMFAAFVWAVLTARAGSELSLRAGDSAWLVLLTCALVGPVLPVLLVRRPWRIAVAAVFGGVLSAFVFHAHGPHGSAASSPMHMPPALLISSAIAVPLAIGVGLLVGLVHDLCLSVPPEQPPRPSDVPLTAVQLRAVLHQTLGEICETYRAQYPSMRFEVCNAFIYFGSVGGIEIFYVVNNDDYRRNMMHNMADELDVTTRTALAHNGYVRQSGQYFGVRLVSQSHWEDICLAGGR